MNLNSTHLDFHRHVRYFSKYVVENYKLAPFFFKYLLFIYKNWTGDPSIWQGAGFNVNLRSWPVTHCMLYSKPDINCDIHLRTYLTRNFCNVSSNNPILKTTATSSKLNAAIKMIFLFCYSKLLLVIVLLTYFCSKTWGKSRVFP